MALGTESDTLEKLSLTEGELQEEDRDQQLLASKSFDVILKSVGDSGKYQWRTCVIASFCGVFFAFGNLAAAFLAATPKHICAPLTSDNDLSTFVSQFGDFSFPNDNKSLQCEYYDGLTKHKCLSWSYDDSVYRSTIVTEEWISSLAQSTYMLGFLIGALVLSELSDMYGRRTVSVISTVGYLIAGISVAFSVNLTMFLSLRFFVAVFGSGIFLTNFVLVMEMVGPSTRTIMGMMYQGFFALGFCLLPGIAYLIRDWRYLQLTIAVPASILLSYFWLLPESPRWLLANGNRDESLKILGKMAQVNGGQLPEDKELTKLLSNIHSAPKHKPNLLGKIADFFKNQAILVRTPIMRRRCLIIFFNWFVVAMVYYGLTFSGGNINASVYLMVFLSGAVEMPSYCLGCWTVSRYGRRINLALCFVICGTACMLILAVPKEMSWLNLTLASTGKFFNSVAFAIVYIYSAELVPTKVRNISVGASNLWARLGSTVAPFIVDYLGNMHYVIPSTVFGLLSLMAGFSALQLPETGKAKLPETIEEVEAMKR